MTISVANDGGDADLTASATALTFTTGNWNTAQTVTVSAATDADADNGTATFSHTPVGGGYSGVAAASVVTTEADVDTRGVAVAPTALSVQEGGSQNYTVKLNTRPSGEVTVSIARTGDGDLSASANALTFTTANWSAAQTVTVSARTDDDGDNGRAIFAHDASGGGYGAVAAASVVATEVDGDTRGVAVAPTSLSVPEGGKPCLHRGSGHKAVRQRYGRGRAKRRRRLRPHGIGDRPDLHHRELGRRANGDRERGGGCRHRRRHRDLLPHPERRRL